MKISNLKQTDDKNVFWSEFALKDLRGVLDQIQDSYKFDYISKPLEYTPNEMTSEEKQGVANQYLTKGVPPIYLCIKDSQVKILDGYLKLHLLLDTLDNNWVDPEKLMVKIIVEFESDGE